MSNKNTPLSKRLLTRRQVAELLGGVDVSFVRRLEIEGRLRPIRLTRAAGSKVFFAAEAVDALIAEAESSDE